MLRNSTILRDPQFLTSHESMNEYQGALLGIPESERNRGQSSPEGGRVTGGRDILPRLLIQTITRHPHPLGRPPRRNVFSSHLFPERLAFSPSILAGKIKVESARRYANHGLTRIWVVSLQVWRKTAHLAIVLKLD